jgi:hypothetical protein
MDRKPLDFTQKTALTRVSVTSSAGYYTVRNGNEPPVRVRVVSSGLQCECGRPRCSHIATLIMCGFVEQAMPDSMAA